MPPDVTNLNLKMIEAQWLLQNPGKTSADYLVAVEKGELSLLLAGQNGTKTEQIGLDSFTSSSAEQLDDDDYFAALTEFTIDRGDIISILQDCIDYIFNLTINRTFDGFLREKSVVNDGLAKIFPNIVFEESNAELDHAGDIDYIAKIGNKAFGIQIKPVTAKANFGNYSASERMKVSFADFEDKFGGKVFIVFSLDGEIANKEVIEEIKKEINRLT